MVAPEIDEPFDEAGVGAAQRREPKRRLLQKELPRSAQLSAAIARFQRINAERLSRFAQNLVGRRQSRARHDGGPPIAQFGREAIGNVASAGGEIAGAWAIAETAETKDGTIDRHDGIHREIGSAARRSPQFTWSADRHWIVRGHSTANIGQSGAAGFPRPKSSAENAAIARHPCSVSAEVGDPGPPDNTPMPRLSKPHKRRVRARSGR